MAYDPNSRRGASEGRALRNVEQLLDEHRQSIIEVHTIVGKTKNLVLIQTHFLDLFLEHRIHRGRA